MRRYPIYNKPWVLAQWFKMVKPTEEYFLVLDSDMVIHRPFLPEQFGLAPGTFLSLMTISCGATVCALASVGTWPSANSSEALQSNTSTQSLLSCFRAGWGRYPEQQMTLNHSISGSACWGPSPHLLLHQLCYRLPEPGECPKLMACRSTNYPMGRCMCHLHRPMRDPPASSWCRRYLQETVQSVTDGNVMRQVGRLHRTSGTCRTSTQ